MAVLVGGGGLGEALRAICFPLWNSIWQRQPESRLLRPVSSGEGVLLLLC